MLPVRRGLRLLGRSRGGCAHDVLSSSVFWLFLRISNRWWGKKKPPSAGLLYEGRASMLVAMPGFRASAASTRFPITTSIPRACITVDGSLRTGHRSNSRHRRGGRIPGAAGRSGNDGRCECRIALDADQKPVVIRISPMAHFAVGFLALGMLALVLAGPAWVALLLVIPVMLSATVIRCRTVADSETVTARSPARAARPSAGTTSTACDSAGPPGRPRSSRTAASCGFLR